MHITLKQIEVFTAVVEHLNYTHAAKILNMTQPAVSSQIKNLETQLGVSLFEQVGKKVTLTDVARQLLPRIHMITSEVDRFVNEVNSIRGMHTGKLVVSVSAGQQKKIFSLLKDFQEEYPAIVLQIDILDRLAQLKHLQQNKVDFCFAGKPPREASLLANEIFHYETVAICAMNNPLAKQKKVSLERLSQERIIAGEHFSNSRTILESVFDLKSCKVTQVNNTDSVKYVVAIGMGIGIVPLDTLHKDLINKHYVILDVEGFPKTSTYYLVSRSSKLLSPAAKRFKAFTLNYFQENNS